jgi:zinc protease
MPAAGTSRPRSTTASSLSASPKPGVDFARIEQVMDAVIADIVQNGIPADDLDRIKTQLVSSAIYAQDNQVEMARWYGSALTAGESIDSVMGWADNVRAVTVDEVRDAARKWLDKKRSVTGYLVKDTAPHAEEKRS